MKIDIIHVQASRKKEKRLKNFSSAWKTAVSRFSDTSFMVSFDKLCSFYIKCVDISSRQALVEALLWHSIEFTYRNEIYPFERRFIEFVFASSMTQWEILNAMAQVEQTRMYNNSVIEK